MQAGWSGIITLLSILTSLMRRKSRPKPEEEEEGQINVLVFLGDDPARVLL